MPNTTSRNDLITQWALPYTEDYIKTASPFANNTFNDFIHIQGDHLPSELLDDSQQSLYQLYPPQRLDSPFQSPVALLFASPSSSASGSPIFSSPAFSTIKSPTTADLSTSWDGALNEAQSMSASSSRNPSIQIQKSSPSSQHSRPYPSQALTSRSPMLAQHGLPSTHGWHNDTNMQLLSPIRAHNGLGRRNGLHATHKRAQSGSSGTSGGGHSPHTYDQMNGLESYQNNGNGKSLPTPVQTPIQNSFLAAAFQNGDNAEVERAMRQAVYEHQQQLSHQADDDTFNYSSLPPSVSSMSHHNSPATPQTSYEELDDGSKSMAHDFNNPHSNAMPAGLPKLNRTISDIYQDELYSTGIVPSTQARKQQQQNAAMLTPYRNMFADRLQAANQGHLSARSQSPSNSISRERSPFRQGSELASALAVSGLPANMQLSHTGMDLGAQQDSQAEPKTISPKDALLEYHETPEDVAMPSLFPTTSSGSNYQMAGEALGLRRDSSSAAFQPTQNYSQMESFPNQYAQQAAGLRQPFYVPQPQQQMAAHPNPRRHPAASNNLIHQTPEFPASLPSMESSTASDTKEQVQRPADTSSDSGTYTCTYHGCTLRFETPAKLQKHKREAHRQTMPGQLASRETASNSLAMRNSQAGPHKCERINPSTGKPCNSIFSRPYDLTRHEDTIHNARKQKVRCHLCQEEKTFSRNDALTRHMRVVHPEVDWPGKQRRKGRD